jgi:hypothetical protein
MFRRRPSRSVPAGFALAFLAACTAGEPVETPEVRAEEAAPEADADGWLRAGDDLAGADLEVRTPADLFAEADALDGQQVLVEGRISKVCQASGCWFSFQQEGEDLYVFFEDAAGEEFVVPKDTAGRQVRLVG